MDDDFEQSIFTFHFNFMVYLGSWVIETDNRVKKFLYCIYSCAVSAWVLFISYMGILDLIDAIPEVPKIFYNICINLFAFGTWVKTMQIIHKSKRINALRRSLHRNFKTCKDDVEIMIYKAAVSDITFITRLFYFFFVTLYPIWLGLSICSDSFGKRELPLPAKWPFSFDMHDFKSFILLSLFHGSFAFFYLLQALSMDVSMFGLLAQIYREYRFLLKKIEEFGEYYNDSHSEYRSKKNGVRFNVGEINRILQKSKTKQILSQIIMRQRELFSYTEDFEYGYKTSMFLQIFAGGILLTVNGIQAMIVSFHFDVKMSYQLGYVMVIISDILYLCWMTNRISAKCREVGTAFYAIPWYKMDVDIQRDISLVILRSQKPPRVTSGNFVELNLKTFMVFMKNIYSWLALFRQIALK